MKTLKIWLITIAVLLCSTTVSAHDFEVDGIYYNITSDVEMTVAVTYMGEDHSSAIYNSSIIIPQKVEYGDYTYTVTSIGFAAFWNCTGLTSIIIPNSVISLENGAFYGCNGLINITIPNSVTYIGESVFSYCSGLTDVIIPESLTYIGIGMFERCINLTNVTIPKSVKMIGWGAFRYCPKLTSITIPNSVTSIDEEAFYECGNLKTVVNFSELNISTGSNDYGYVGYYADKIIAADKQVDEFFFKTENGIHYMSGYIGTDNEITLPETYNGGSYEIRASVFFGNTNITSITIPYSVTSIGDYAFNGCVNLSTVSIESQSIASMSNLKSYFGEQVTTYIIGEDVTSIGNNAFNGCSSLTDITIPNSVTSIGSSAFYECN